MKIQNNKTFSRVLTKHLVKKFNIETPSESQLNVFTQGLNPIIEQQLEKLKASNLVDDSGDLDLNLFEKRTKEFFKYIPAIKLPESGAMNIVITENDVLSFIRDLKREAVKEGFNARKLKNAEQAEEIECQK